MPTFFISVGMNTRKILRTSPDIELLFTATVTVTLIYLLAYTEVYRPYKSLYRTILYYTYTVICALEARVTRWRNG